jgi:hypothetical protein
MKLIRLALAGLLALSAVQAAAQTFPTVPDHSVIGRIGVPGGSGPSQAIPFATLLQQLNIRSTFYSVKDSPFNAKGDGSTDDTAAINNTISFAIAHGGGTVYFPASTGCYKTSNGIIIDYTALSTRYQGKIHLVGDGRARSCIQNTTFTGVFINYTGNPVALESDFVIQGLRITGVVGAPNAGSVGLRVTKAAYFTMRDVAIEGLDLGFDATDVDQSSFYDSQVRLNNGGVNFNTASSITSPNSIAFFSTTITNNANWGITVVSPNAWLFSGGSIQYNGTTACGGTLTNCYGIRMVDAGTGYGTVLFSGMIFEGNGGMGDFISSQSAGALKINATFNNVSFNRTANFAGLGFGTNQIAISGAGTDANYKIVNSNFYGYAPYTASAGRPAIANTNTNALIEIDGQTKFWSATEAPTTSVIYTGYPNSRTGGISFAGSGASTPAILSANSTATALNWPGSLTLNPTAASTNQGLNVTQTSPTSGSATGPLSFNLINVNDQVSVTTAGVDSAGLSNTNASAFRVNMATGGTNVQGQVISAGLFNVQNSVAGASTSGDLVGVLGAAYSNISHPVHGLFGMNALVRVDTTGVESLAIGIESDVIVATGGSAVYRVAYNATAGGTTQGSTMDAAFMATSATATSKFKKLIALSSLYGNVPLDTAADVFFSDASFTIANFANLSNATVTGNIFDFGSPFKVTGAGATSIGGPLTATVTRTVASASGAVLDDLNIAATTATVTGSTAITNTKGFNKASIYKSTITDASAVTITNAATLYIEGAPTAAGSATITNPFALWVNGGTSVFGGSLGVNITAAAYSILGGASLVAHASTDKNFYTGANFSLSTGVSFGSINDANNVLQGMEFRASLVMVGASGFTVGTTTDPGAGNIGVLGFVKTGAVAVGSLPACAAGTKGARHFVTDANAAFTAGIGAVVAAGGANNVPVTCDGTNWRIGSNDNIPAYLIRKFA